MDAVSAKTNPLNVGNVALIASINPSIRLHHSRYANILIYKRVYSSERGYKREKTAWTFRTEPTCLHYCLFWAWDRHFKCPLQITLLCQILTRVSGYSKVIQLKIACWKAESYSRLSSTHLPSRLCSLFTAAKARKSKTAFITGIWGQQLQTSKWLWSMPGLIFPLMHQSFLSLFNLLQNRPLYFCYSYIPPLCYSFPTACLYGNSFTLTSHTHLRFYSLINF